MGKWGIKGLETRVWRECSISRRGPDCTVEESERVTVLRQGAAPRVRAAKSSEFEGKVVSTLDGPIWSRCSIALTCPARSHFQRTQSKERWGQDWDERYRSSREGEE